MNFATIVTTDAYAQFISVIDTSPQSAWASDAPPPMAALMANAMADSFRICTKLPFMALSLPLISMCHTDPTASNVAATVAIHRKF